MRVSLPEQVWIDYQPAGFGSRALAYFFDFLIRWAIALLVIYTLITLSAIFGFRSFIPEFLLKGRSLSSQIVIAIITLFVFVIEFSYPMYFEVFKNGESPGKKAMGLRVVDERGLPITARASLLRTLLLIFDFFPALGFTALVSMMFSKNSQRLGDLVAKTMVIHQPKNIQASIRNSLELERENSIILPLENYNILEQYLQRKSAFSKEARLKASKSLIEKLASHSSLNPPEETDKYEENENYLEQIFAVSRPARKDSKEEKSLDWKLIEQELSDVQKTFARLENPRENLKAEELFKAADHYQHLCQRYGYLATFFPKTAEARKAAELVRKGRQLIYGKRLGLLNEVNIPFLKRVPIAFDKIRYHCLAAFSLALLGAFFAATLVQLNPQLAWHFLSEQVADQLAEGKIWTQQIRGMSAVAASGIMTNNIKVTLSAFALGISGGVGTALIMIFNGVHLGGIFSALSHYNMTQPLLDFILAHGFLELSVIFVAGGCGFFLGDALLNPGNLSRKQALARNGAALVDLIVFNAICLVLAGIVEGYISPYEEIPTLVKLLIGLSLGALYWHFLLTGAFTPKFSKSRT